ncbi:hypothetical protein KR009_007114, partial [Drosophila setifemur]
DITTVLLINNESGRVGDIHGKFLTVRPDVGLLTSTARTFIQNGITTEFATKVVGTTLNNGRLYAQFLKKSSRVLYKNENLVPSVVTSWVGDSDFQQTPLFLQSHNDLYNADDAEWQNIDDGFGNNRDEFVGNTDFVQSTRIPQSIISTDRGEKSFTSSPSSQKNNTFKSDTDSFKLTDGKVFSIKNLETFTVKNKINRNTDATFKQTTAELYILGNDTTYRQVVQERFGKNVESHIPLSKQVLATVTYYGFAEFTTIVGDSVIVFSPSTVQNNLNFGHVTSIRGRPTLKHEPIHSQTSQVVERIQNSMENGFDLESNIKEKAVLVPVVIGITADAFKSINHVNFFSTPKLDSPTTLEENMFDTYTISLKSNEIENITSTNNARNVTSINVTDIEKESSVHNIGGATTVFLDDDPFTAFLNLNGLPQSMPKSKDFNTIVQSATTTRSPLTITENETSSQHFSLQNNSLMSINVTGTNKNTNYIMESCDHSTSQVFLTQMPKQLEGTKKQFQGARINITGNSLFEYDIVETTKYYCIQATQVEKTTENKEIMVSVNNATNESQSELLSTELDETIFRDLDDYEATTEHEYENDEDDYDNITDDIDLIFKTLYTTYTYLTTFFEGSHTTVSSHTEIVTNFVSSTFEANGEQNSKALNTFKENVFSETVLNESSHEASTIVSKYTIPQELVSLLIPESKINISEIENNRQTTTYIDDIKYTKTLFTTYTYFTSIFSGNETEVMSRTKVITNLITSQMPKQTSIYIQPQNINLNLSVQTSTHKIKMEEHTTFVLDVKSSRFNSEYHDISKKTDFYDDQVSSESNTEEILPSATFLLQTSFTTFTFYTTMYAGVDTNIVSRLETVTNVATETLQPSQILKLEEASFPVTYFTTFTYWTKLAKDGEITTLSREETLSNVIQPTNITKTTHNFMTADGKYSILSQNDSVLQNLGERNTTQILNDKNFRSNITTFFTTYTYYTTSYEVNKTITHSRLETITNVVTASEISPVIRVTETMIPHPLQTGNRSEYKLKTNTSNVVLYDYKQIIDADEVSTLYFTTKILSSVNSEGYDIEITTSTSRLLINESKKASLATLSSHISGESLSFTRILKTGLVRLIEGTRIQNNTTTLYQSKVIGTVVNNRYAQIIESTSSFLFEKTIAEDNLYSTNIIHQTMALENGIMHSTNLSGGDKTIYTEDKRDTKELANDNADDELTIDLPNSTKRTFAPVIRPFASRNRPTFAPKQKTPSPISATIITRADITPTITATPALKSAGRYSSSRRGLLSNAPTNSNESLSNQIQSSRRLFGRPTKLLSVTSEVNGSIQSSIAFLPSRNRFASSLRTFPIVSSRRQNTSGSYRSFNTSGFRGTGSSKQRIKPTTYGSVLGEKSTMFRTVVKEFSSDSSTDEEDSTFDLDHITDEEENVKRNQNPLLRFRRPLNRPSGFISISRSNPSSPPVTSQRRNPLLPRTTTSTSTSTITTTAKPLTQSFQRPTLLQARSRPQSTLFPPRGLFQSLLKDESVKEVKPIVDEFQNDSEYDDEDDVNDEEEIGHDEVIRSKQRVRRQTDSINRSRFRFRNQPEKIPKEQKINISGEFDEITSNHRVKSSSRFGSRFHSTRSQHTQITLLNSTAVTNHKPIRATRPISKRPQFTLREKDSTLKGTTRSSSTTHFRRQPQTSNLSTKRPAGNSNSRRIKGYSNYNTKNNEDNGRSSSTTRSRNLNTNTSKRGRGSARGRNRIDYASDLQLIEQEDQSIKVTHFIPAEVTIPVVSGHLTEYKHIVTAKTSTEFLGPNQYTQVLGKNGLTSTYLNREETTINGAGLTEYTKYLLHESITSTVTFTPTTIRGRKTSFSHILPSTVYSVENLVTTKQPQISANAPLANILLSQLLLGNLNLPGNPIGPVGQQQNVISAIVPTSAEPITEYRTHTSTYVTTIFDGKSTIVPVTFQGKKILTTVYDTTAQTITATEYSVDTIVNAPPVVQNIQSVGQVNSLLLQQLLLQQQQEPLSLAHVFSKTLSPQILLTENLLDLESARSTPKSDVLDDINFESDKVSISNDMQATKNFRKKSRKASTDHKRSKQHQLALVQNDPSVVTLYISGRRPGEFSTVLSTVQNSYDHSASLQKRQAYINIRPTVAMANLKDFIETEGKVSGHDSSLISKKTQLAKDNSPVEIFFNEVNIRTASLESIVGDVDLWFAKSSKQSILLSTTIDNGSI